MKNHRIKSAKLSQKKTTYRNHRRLYVKRYSRERYNKDEKNIKVKIRKYPGPSSIDILDYTKPSLPKAPEQIILHAGTNGISNNTNYLKNVEKIDLTIPTI